MPTDPIPTSLPAKGEWPCQHDHTVPAPPALVAFLYRLLRDGAPAPSDVENHAIQADKARVGTDYTNPWLEAYARSLAGYLLRIDRPGLPGPPSHRPMSKGDLLTVLDDIFQRVRNDDSFEGSIEYLMPGPLGLDDDADFAVMASYRVGNREGQGGVRLIRADTPAAQGGPADASPA